jgi:hypothetical protein
MDGDKIVSTENEERTESESSMKIPISCRRIEIPFNIQSARPGRFYLDLHLIFFQWFSFP